MSKTLLPSQGTFLEEGASFQQRINLVKSSFLSFDYDLVSSNFTQVYSADKSAHLSVPYEFNIAARRKIFAKLDIHKLSEDIACASNAQAQLWLAQALKYLVRNGHYVDIEELITLVNGGIRDDIRSEVVFTIAYNLEHRTESIGYELYHSIIALLQIEGISESSKEILQKELARQSSLDSDPFALIKGTMFGSMISAQTPEVTVTKNQQLSKQVYTHLSSEATEAKTLDLTEALRQQTKKIKFSINNERLPTLISTDESVIGWLSTPSTYTSIVKIYNTVTAGRPISADNINYLVSAFKGPGVKVGATLNGGIIESIFIDKMIARVLKVAASKQMLSLEVVSSLFPCIEEFDVVQAQICGTSRLQDLASKIAYTKHIHNKAYAVAPPIISSIANNLYDCLEFKAVKKWFGFSESREFSAYYSSRIIKIVQDEIQAIRKDVIDAIHSSVVRDDTYLSSELVTKLEACISDANADIRAKAAKTLAIGKKGDYKKLFEYYLEQLEAGTQESVTAAAFISNQVEDQTKCMELFKNSVLTRLINVIDKTLNKDVGLACAQTISCYLGYDFTTPLSHSHLAHVLKTLSNPTIPETIQNHLLSSILLSADKAQSLPIDIVNRLLGIVDHFHINQKYMTAVLLSNIVENLSLCDITQISDLLNSDIVVVEDGLSLKFEQRTEANRHSTSLSSIVADMILTMHGKGFEHNSITIKHVFEALESSDKQTQILASKILSSLNNKDIVDDQDLFFLRPFLESAIPDVLVHTKLAYAQIANNLTTKLALISSSHLEILGEIYAYKPLTLSSIDYTSSLNDPILNVIKLQSTKQQFPESIAKIFEFILYRDLDYADLALTTLEIQSSYFLIPDNVTSAVENVIYDPKLRSSAQNILKHVISQGGKVGSKTLEVFKNKLIFGESIEERKCAFEILEIASRTHDLPDQIFNMLELHRAGISIKNRLSDSEHAYSFVEQWVKDGYSITEDVFSALGGNLHKNIVKEILLRCALNQHIIPDHILDKLENRFDPAKHQQKLLKILAHAVENNQVLHQSFLQKLELAIENRSVSDIAFQIFAHEAERNTDLSDNIIHYLLSKFAEGPNQKSYYITNQLLSKYSSSLSEEILAKAESVLRNAIKSHLDSDISEGIKGLQIIKTLSSQLSQDSIQILLTRVEDTNVTEALRHGITKLLDTESLTLQQQNHLQLAQLLKDDAEAFIKTLEECGPDISILQKNYIDLASILDRTPVLHLRGLQLLKSYSNKNEFPDDIITTIDIIHKSSVFLVKSLAGSLLQDIASTGRLLPESIKVPQHKHYKIYSDLRFFTQSDITKILIDLIEQQGDGVRIDYRTLKALLNYPKTNSILSDEFIHVISHEYQSSLDKKYFPKISEIFCQAIINGCTNNKLLETFSSLVTLGYTANLNIALDQLIHAIRMVPGLDYKSALNIVTQACNLGIFTEKLIKFLESGLLEENPYIRSFAFDCLSKLQAQAVYSGEVLEKWSKMTYDNFIDATSLDIEKTNTLLQALASITFIDTNNLKKSLPESCIKELLLTDIIHKCTTNHLEQVKLYHLWLALEEDVQYDNLYILSVLQLLQAKLLNISVAFNELSTILRIIPKLEKGSVTSILESDTDLVESLKLSYAEKLLFSKIDHVEFYASYIKELAREISYKMPFEVLSKLLENITHIESLKEFSELISFSEHYSLDIEDLYYVGSLSEIRNSLEIKFLEKMVDVSHDKIRFMSVVEGLLSNDWTFDDITQLLSKVKSHAGSALLKSKMMGDFLHILEMVSTYKIQGVLSKEFVDILSLNPKSWIKEAQKIIVKNSFSTIGNIKSTTELIQELEYMNQPNKKVIDFVKRDLNSLIVAIKAVDLKTSILSEGLTISTMSSEQIGEWSDIVKGRTDLISDDDLFVEGLAVVKRAVFLKTSFELKDTQIMSVILGLHPQEGHGRLMQVATGEGKSIIISAVAIMKALSGEHVDIVTSSPVLAERDSLNNAKLYNMFGLTVADNNDKSEYIQGVKDCYQKDIVYGEAAQFQFDILRDEYSKLGTRSERGYKFVIIDEADSMLLDDSSKIARLATSVPGLDQIEPMYFFLWQRFNLLVDKMVAIDGNMYFFYGKLQNHKGTWKLNFDQKSSTKEPIDDLAHYLKTHEDISEIGKHIDDPTEFIKSHLREYASEHLLAKNIVKFPKHFNEFVRMQIPKWVDNLILASNYIGNCHYIVQDGVIKPVDFNSTGIVQSSTNWSHGLHQFLQIKHGLKITPETFTTNFLSNIGFFQRYGANHLGLSATFGSDKSQLALTELYHDDIVKIPHAKAKQYIEFPVKIAASETEWFFEVCRSALYESQKGRGVLVICETIQQTQALERLIKFEYKHAAVKVYSMNNMDQEKFVAKLEPGEIIVATNLAGRGTDINTEAIEQFGGMHVIVTTMPSNQRVEDQAFGRTSRQGKCGTGELILTSSNLEGYDSMDPRHVKMCRDELEGRLIDEFASKELPLIVAKDKLFSKFCSLLDFVRNDIRINHASFWGKLKSVVKYSGPSILETTTLSAIEEQWAMFLNKIDDGLIGLDKADEEYMKYEQKIHKEYADGTVVKNPYHHIIIGNHYLAESSIFSDSYDLAHKHFDKAIELDPDFSAAAFVGRAWLMLTPKSHYWEGLVDGAPSDVSDAALKEFMIAEKIIDDQLQFFIAVNSMLPSANIGRDSALSKQLLEKHSILGSYYNAIKSASATILKAERLIDVLAEKRYQSYEQYREDGETTVARSDYSSSLDKSTVAWSQLMRNSAKGLDVHIPTSYDRYDVIFNHLTSFSDMDVVKDQAASTVSDSYTTKFGMMKRKVLDNSYSNIHVEVKHIPGEHLKEMFMKDIELQGVSRDAAISQLENKSSFLHRFLPETIAPESCRMDLEVFTEGKTVSKHSNILIRDAISIIKTSAEKGQEYNIKLINANEGAKLLESAILPHIALNVEFCNLDMSHVQAKLRDVVADSISIEFCLQLEELVTFVHEISSSITPDTQNLYKLKIKDDKTAANITTDTIYIHEAITRLSSYEKGIHSISLENLDITRASFITDLLSRIVSHRGINVKFTDITVKDSLDSFVGSDLNISFTHINNDVSKILIPYLRKENLEFSLGFDGLTSDQLSKIVSIASIMRENIEITKVRTLSDLYMDDAKPTRELLEFMSQGIEYLIEIAEKKFVPWRTVATLSSLATLQMAAGAICVATGFGASFGMGAITEGAADLFTAYRAYSSREFSWTDFAKQKAVSIMVSVCTGGLSGLKDAGKGVKTAMTAAGQEVLEQTTTLAITNGKTVTKTALETLSKLKSLAGKQVATAVCEAAAREVGYKAMDSLAHFSTEQIRPAISEAIQSKVQDRFMGSDIDKLMKILLSIDNISENQFLKTQIDQAVLRAINPASGELGKFFNGIALPLCKGILASSQNYGGKWSMVFRIGSTLHGMKEIYLIIDTVHKKLTERLEKLASELASIPVLLKKYCGIKDEDIDGVSQLLKEKSIVLGYKEINLDLCRILGSNPVTVNFGIYEHYKQGIMTFLSKLASQVVTTSIDEGYFSRIMKSVSDMITDQCLRITESNLISPWSSFAVSAGVSAMSAHIQDGIIRSSEEFSEDVKEIGGPTPMKKKDLLTFSKLISYNAEKYVKAYSQAEIIHYAAKKDAKVRGVKKVEKEYIDSICSGKEAGLAEMSVMASIAAQHGIQVKIVDTEDYNPTPEEIESGIKIIVYSKGAKSAGVDQIGHWKLLGEDSTVDLSRVGNNDCGYEVFAKLLDSDVETLRQKTAKHIEQNIATFGKAIEAQQWIEQRYPQEANSILFMGGIDPKKLAEIFNGTLEAAKHKMCEYISKLSFVSDEMKATLNTEFSKLHDQKDILKAKMIFYIIHVCEKQMSGKGVEIFKGAHCMVNDNGQIYELLMQTGMMKHRTSSHHKDDKPKSDASCQVGELFPEFLIGRTAGQTWFQLEKSPVVGTVTDNLLKAAIFLNPLTLLVTAIASLVPGSDSLKIHGEEASNVVGAIVHSGDYLVHKAKSVNISNYGTTPHIEGPGTQLDFELIGEEGNGDDCWPTV